MMSLRRILPLVAAAGLTMMLATAQPACAQETTAPAAAKKARPAGGKREAAGPVKAALGVSGLTGEQKSKLRGVQKEYAAKLKDLRSNDGGAGAGKKKGGKQARAKMAKLNKDTRTQIEAILNEEQKKEFAEALKKAAPKGATKAGDSSSTGSRKRR